MMKALYLLLLVSGSALADDAALLKCRSVSDASARLACYDAIPAGQAAASQGAARSAVPPMLAPAQAAAPARTAAQDFGFEAKKEKKAEENSVESSIVGTFRGWGPGAQITLANGQVWRVIDGSSADLTPMDNPKAKVVRNFFGTLFMEIQGTNHSPKVRRVK
jgi:hypothetical protein